MFVCFDVCSELKRDMPLYLVPTYYYAMESFVRMFQNGSNKSSCFISFVSFEAEIFCRRARPTAFPRIRLG
jgi:hypothetical protein